MISLRDQLKEESPELYHALVKSWDIGVNQWLPAILPSHDSYNSYPHLRNLEQHLENIIDAVNSKLACKVILKPCEKYIILCAILFHDMGRVLEEQDEKGSINFREIKLADGSEEQPRNHAEASSLMIQKDWARYGIYSEELADVLQKICFYHDPPPLEKNPELVLKNKRIDPYGYIREKELCSLLVLIDQMDNAYQRAEPKYIKPIDESGVKAAFRHHIKSVTYDPIAQMLVISTDSLNNKTRDSVPENDDGNDFFYYQRITPPILDADDLAIIIEKTKLQKWGDKSWTDREIALLTMCSVRKINSVLKSNIQQNLIKLGIQVRECVIEYHDILFTHFGDITSEPVLHREYLISIARSMWSLCSEIFGPQEFSYETLAAEVREVDIEKIKMAVKRLSIISGLKMLEPISADISQWSWNLFTNKKEKCKVLKLRELIDKIPPGRK